jgi:tetratricopeptide (TPR) repeat protein
VPLLQRFVRLGGGNPRAPYEDHDSDDLSRIDRKRVEQYVAEHGLNDSEEAGETARREEQVTEDLSTQPSETDTILSGDRWELHDVEALSTAEIVGKLDKLGIETDQEAFSEQVGGADSAREVTRRWCENSETEIDGFDYDFVMMAAEVLWARWLPDVPNKERIYDLVQEGRSQKEAGNAAEACERWLTAWEFIAAVTPAESTTLEDAERHLPSFLSLEAFLRSVDSTITTLAAEDATYHEQRLEFCREVCDQFPDPNDEFRLDFRHFVADSLAELGQHADSRAEYEAIIEEYPDDPWAYKKLADSYWHESEALTSAELERVATLYQQALDTETPIEKPSAVSERLDEVESELADRAENDKSTD